MDIPHLRNALRIVKPAVYTRKGGVLSHVRLTLADGVGTLCADNLELRVVAPIAGPDTVDAVLPHAALVKLCRGKGEISAAVADGACTITTPAGATVLPCLPLEDWPTPVLPQPDHVATVDLATLHAVAVCVAADQARPILTAVLVGEEYAATDSYRLRHGGPAPYWFGDDTAGSTVAPVLVPGTALAPLPRTGPATLTHDGRRVAICAAGVTVLARAVDGEFPRYGSLIPTPSSRVHTITATGLRSACADIARFVGKDAAPVIFTPDPDGVRLTATVPDGGTMVRVLPGSCTIEKVAYNPAFLRDLVTDDETIIELVDAAKPAIIAGPVESLIMPVRTT